MYEIMHPITGESIKVALQDFDGDEDDGRVSSWYEAMQLCQELGKSWRLPTKIELKAIYEQLHLKGIGNFKDGYCYWSSSEKDEHSAWFVSFDNGKADINGKEFPDYVRIVQSS